MEVVTSGYRSPTGRSCMLPLQLLPMELLVLPVTKRVDSSIATRLSNDLPRSLYYYSHSCLWEAPSVFLSIPESQWTGEPNLGPVRSLSICMLLPQSTSQVAQRPAATPRACSQTVACDLDVFQSLVPEYCTHCPRHHFDNPAARGSIDTVHTVSPHKSTSMNQKRASFIWRDRTNVDDTTTRSQHSTAD